MYVIEDFWESMQDRHGFSKKEILSEELYVETTANNSGTISVKWKISNKKARYISLLISQFIRENIETPAEIKAFCMIFKNKAKGYQSYIIPKAEIFINKKDIDVLKNKALKHLEKTLKKVKTELVTS